jgi:hypothetical protein
MLLKYAVIDTQKMYQLVILSTNGTKKNNQPTEQKKKQPTVWRIGLLEELITHPRN